MDVGGVYALKQIAEAQINELSHRKMQKYLGARDETIKEAAPLKPLREGLYSMLSTVSSIDAFSSPAYTEHVPVPAHPAPLSLSQNLQAFFFTSDCRLRNLENTMCQNNRSFNRMNKYSLTNVILYAKLTLAKAVITGVFPPYPASAHRREIQQDLPHPDAQSNPSCMQAYLLLQYGEIRNEPEAPAVYHGTFGPQRDAECLHPCAVRRRTGRAASSSKSLKHPVGKEHSFTNRFTNIAGKT